MSQRGTASLPVSRASSQSPRPLPSTSAPVPATHPIPSAIQDAAPYNPARNPPGVASGTAGQSTSQRSRPFDVYHMISDPSDSHMSASRTPPGTLRPDFQSRAAPAGHSRVVSEPPSISQQPQYQHSPPYPLYQRPPLGVSPPIASPRADRPLLGIQSRDRVSPTMVSPLPALHHPRPSLNSQLPSAQSLHNPILRGTESLHTSPRIPSVAGQKRSFESDIKQKTSSPSTRLAGSSYLGPPVPQATLPSTSAVLQTSPSRSFSQPVHPNHYQHGPFPQEGAWSHSQQSSQSQGGWEPQRDMLHGKSLVEALLANQQLQASSRVGTRQRGRGRGAARGGLSTSRAPGSPEVSSLRMRHPDGGETDVPLDIKSASRAASIKRLGGAKASAESRQRKKGRRLEAEERCEQLEDELKGMRQQLQESYRYREALDFYKRERDRLRDLVLRTPGISEAARGPPSPQLTTITHPAMFSGSAPLNLPPPPPSTHATGLAGYASSENPTAERPAQRRRTDGASDLGPFLYGQHQQPQPHEPFRPSSGHPYAIPSSRPGSASSTQLLPSLRALGTGGMETSATPGRHYGGQATHETGFHYPPREPEGGRGPR